MKMYLILEMMNIGKVLWWVEQLDDFDFGLGEAMEALDVGGRHLGNYDIQGGLLI